MNWYIGQEIVCVKTHSEKAVIRGRTYKINGLKRSYCNCGHTIIDVGIASPANCIHFCAKCKFQYRSVGICYISEQLFAPLDQDISELTEVLEKEATR